MTDHPDSFVFCTTKPRLELTVATDNGKVPELVEHAGAFFILVSKSHDNRYHFRRAVPYSLRSPFRAAVHPRHEASIPAACEHCGMPGSDCVCEGPLI